MRAVLFWRVLRLSNDAWSDGISHLLVSQMELLEKLAALVPPSRFHLDEPSAANGDASAGSWGHRLRWATLLARVFSSDNSECAGCGVRGESSRPRPIRPRSGPIWRG